MRKLIKRMLPGFVKRVLHAIRFRMRRIKADFCHRKALQRINVKNKINVVFLVVLESVWKCDKLYRMMEKDERYEPIILICPNIHHNDKQVINNMKSLYSQYISKGYNVKKAFNESTKTYIDVKKDLDPDIIITSDLWNHTVPNYSINKLNDLLICYVPYGRHGLKKHYPFKKQFDMLSCVWKIFLDSRYHYDLAIKYSKNQGKNAVYTGYPGVDMLVDQTHVPADVWKVKQKKLKRIIWAPHWTICGYGGDLKYSTFMSYYDFIFELANKYIDEIQIAFKPHPILHRILSRPDVWGEAVTDKYYKKWQELENGQLVQGDYIDLFLTSDAMIHDCVTFMIDYLYTSKPILHLIDSELIVDQFSEIGKMAFEKSYHGKSKKDIETFINKVVKEGKDFMCADRILFCENQLKPPNGVSASENIFNNINESINI